MAEITIRPARVEDAPSIARVHIDSWRTTYNGIVPDEVLAGLSYEKRERDWRMRLSDPERKNFDFVAEDGQGQIVGFVTGGPLRGDNSTYQSELYAIYLLKEFQGQGLGRRLMLKLVERLAQEAMTSMLLWVLAENPARRFYEAMGGQPVKTQPIEIGGVMLEEVAYGWPEIRTLL
jgi:ribosomal protein S18 acetylase RimI-like enzyme